MRAKTTICNTPTRRYLSSSSEIAIIRYGEYFEISVINCKFADRRLQTLILGSV